MEAKINVAEILKDKPKGTKLYSDICCGECVLNEVSENAIYGDMENKLPKVIEFINTDNRKE